MKAAVIGAGVICEQHLIALRRVPGVALAAVCDLSPTMAGYTAERFGAEAAYTDYRRMLDHVRPSVVHVLTPPTTHVAIVRDALDAGAHVIVEKPIAPTHASFSELWSHALRAGRRLIEDQNYRFNTPVRRIDAMVGAGDLGPVREVELRMALDIRAPGHRYADRNLPHASHGMPAGVLHEFLPHLCYLLTHLLRVSRGDVAPDCVKAVWSNHGGGDLFRYDDVDALVRFGELHGRIRFTCHAGPDAFAVAVRGRRGHVEADLFHPRLRVVRPRAGGPHIGAAVDAMLGGAALAYSGPANLARKVRGRWSAYEGLHRLVHETYHALQSGGEMPVTFADMDAASRMLDALVREAEPASAGEEAMAV